MNNSIRYNLFILLSSISRSLIEVFSLVFLYKMGYSIKNILLFLVIMYSSGIVSNSISIIISSRINYKYLLIISSIIFCISYYYLSIMECNMFNLVILGILMSFGNYMYHTMRHFVALQIKDIKVNNILIWNYIGIIFTSLIGAYITSRNSIFTNTIVVMFISIISIIPLIRFRDNNILNKNYSLIKLGRKKLFFIMEQFKVVLCELQGLFLFLYIDSNIFYIGIFNVFVGVASVIFLLYFNKFGNKYFKYINIVLCLFLLLKINIDNKYILYIIGFIEGLGLKEFEYFSTSLFYDRGINNIYGYLFWCEIIFSISKIFIVLMFYLFFYSLYWMMFICIIGIFICSFYCDKG